MAGVTHEEFGKMKDQVGTAMNSLNTRMDSLERTLKEQQIINQSNFNILVEKINGSESRVVNRLGGIVGVCLAIAVAVLGYIINNNNDKPDFVYLPAQAQSSIQAVPVQPVAPQPILPPAQNKTASPTE